MAPNEQELSLHHLKCILSSCGNIVETKSFSLQEYFMLIYTCNDVNYREQCHMFVCTCMYMSSG